MKPATLHRKMLEAAQQMVQDLRELRFSTPVAHVYNPLEYVWDGYAQYVNRYAYAPVESLFLGMNPGPWGMAQTGVPFGEVSVVRTWLAITPEFEQPSNPHPLRPIEGVACKRSEVSGARLWGLMQSRFGTAEAFFKQAFVANYCPLAFMESSSRNRTPDKLPAAERLRLYAICNAHLRTLVQLLSPKWLIGVGQFAEDRARDALVDVSDIQFVRIQHPSPANPASNRGWASLVTKQLETAGVW